MTRTRFRRYWTTIIIYTDGARQSRNTVLPHRSDLPDARSRQCHEQGKPNLAADLSDEWTKGKSKSMSKWLDWELIVCSTLPLLPVYFLRAQCKPDAFLRCERMVTEC